MKVYLDGKPIRMEEVTWDTLMDARCTINTAEDPGAILPVDVLNGASRALWLSWILFDAKFVKSLMDQLDRNQGRMDMEPWK